MRHFYPIMAGAAERFRRYSAGLRARGVDLRAFTLRDPQDLPEEETVPGGVPVRRIKLTGTVRERDHGLLRVALEEFERSRRRPDVLQLSLASSALVPLLWRARLRGISCLYEGTMVGEAADRGLLEAARYRSRHQYYFSPYNRLVAGSTVMAGWLRSAGVGSHRICIISHAVDTTRFRPEGSEEGKREIRRRLGLEAAGWLVLFVGSIVPRKGVDLLLRAWQTVAAQVPEARLVLVGGFSRPTFMEEDRMKQLSEFQDRMVASSRQPEFKGSVLFTGEVEKVEDYYRAADLFVLPSKQEGMVNAALEAMATGLPCVLTPPHGFPQEEFGQPGVHFGLVDHDETALAGAIVDLLQDRGNRGRMAEQAREWACRHFALDRVLDRHTKVYRSLAKR